MHSSHWKRFVVCGAVLRNSSASLRKVSSCKSVSALELHFFLMTPQTPTDFVALRTTLSTRQNKQDTVASKFFELTGFSQLQKPVCLYLHLRPCVVTNDGSEILCSIMAQSLLGAFNGVGHSNAEVRATSQACTRASSCGSWWSRRSIAPRRSRLSVPSTYSAASVSKSSVITVAPPSWVLCKRCPRAQIFLSVAIIWDCLIVKDE